MQHDTAGLIEPGLESVRAQCRLGGLDAARPARPPRAGPMLPAQLSAAPAGR